MFSYSIENLYPMVEWPALGQDQTASARMVAARGRDFKVIISPISAKLPFSVIVPLEFIDYPLWLGLPRLCATAA